MKLFSGTPLSQFSDRPAAKTAPKAPAAAPAIPETSAKSPLRIVPIPRLAAGGRWRIEAMRSLSEPLLLWFTRGQGRITVGGVTRGYGVHNAIFIPAGVMHGFEVGAQTYGTAVFFGRGCTTDLPQTPQHLRIREVGPQAELSGLIDNIQRELESGKPGAERAAQHHLGLLGVWLERHVDADGAGAKKSDAARRLAARYSALLESEFRSGKGVAEYARALGVTPTHLTRVCNQTCGRSASDILHDRVIFEARVLLAETGMPIARISEALGFTSAAYFTRAFQHRTGKTPSAFRRSV
ncbi:AraC family transcriptional regulator [Defluviimonas sp. SAOS-178_SWC]|uniref:AraC family transcriptional regulator n=1 Tax=Defluviimonas sp. SAOS-178_SWC TaxID=3121287 RepID=UPI0032217188